MIHPPKKPMEGGFSLDKFMPGLKPEDAEAFADALESADPSTEDEPVVLDPFYQHEVVDRLHIALCFMDDQLLDHPFVLAHPDLKNKLEIISNSLGEAYQDASNIQLNY